MQTQTPVLLVRDIRTVGHEVFALVPIETSHDVGIEVGGYGLPSALKT